MNIGGIVVDMERVKIELDAKAALIKKCATDGHVASGHGAVTGFREQRTYDVCPRCGLSYMGRPTEKESARYQELMNTEFR